MINQSIFNCLSLKYQKIVSTAIKRARIMAILPFNITKQKEVFRMYRNDKQKSSFYKKNKN